MVRSSKAGMGAIPSAWRAGQIRDVATCVAGGRLGLTKADYVDSGFPAFSASGQDGFVNVAEFDRAAVVVAAIGARCGKAFLAHGRWSTLANTQVLLPNGDAVDARYLWYVVNDETYWHRSGSAQPFISPKSILDAWLPLPPLPEQRKIAAILSSVDEASQATQAVIDQTRRVREGLLQDLLTRGIGHTRFKQTEIGEIPEGWEVALLDAVTERGSGHTPSKQHPEYWNGTIRWVSLADGHRLDDVYITTTESCITPAGIANSSAVLHPAGTVIVSRDASVGRSAIAACDLAVSQHFIAWRCSERLNNLFLYYFLQRHKPQFEQIAVGSTIKTIGLGYFKKLKVPLPSIQEQQAIAMRLLSTDEALWSHAQHRAALVSAKSGLLTDLLTGKVRVTP